MTKYLPARVSYQPNGENPISPPNANIPKQQNKIIHMPKSNIYTSPKIINKNKDKNLYQHKIKYI
jgi:hypothetical protein